MIDLLPENLPAINAHVQSLGWIPPGATLANPRSAGEGNMNRTLRFDCLNAAAMRSIVLKQAVPFVAKYPDIAAPIERGAAEAAFYHAAQNHPQLEQRLPRLLGTDMANHLLALEDLGSAADLTAAYSHSQLAHKLPEIMPTLLRWLGDLHSITPPRLANMCMRELNHTHIFDLPLQPNNGLELGELQSVARRYAADQALVAQAARLGDIYIGKLPHASRPALLHGDFYPGSWLGSPDNPASINVIDPEFAFVGPAEFDVGVCLAHLQFAGMSLDEAMHVIEHYPGQTGFDSALARGFAGIEIIRRLLGVAQLPLAPDTSLATKLDWVETGRELVLASAG